MLVAVSVRDVGVVLAATRRVAPPASFTMHDGDLRRPVVGDFQGLEKFTTKFPPIPLEAVTTMVLSSPATVAQFVLHTGVAPPVHWCPTESRTKWVAGAALVVEATQIDGVPVAT